MIIDNELSWKPHIASICSKIAKNIGIMTKARSVFSKDTLLSLYYSFIYPYISYCIHVWGSTFETYMKKMFSLQKRVIRIIGGVNRRADCIPIFTSLCILPLQDIFKYNVGFFMYKFYHGKLSQIFNIFQRNSEIHDHDTRQLLHLPKPKTEYGKRSFRYQAVQIWNELYNHIRVDIKIGTFKKKMKSYLLKT